MPSFNQAAFIAVAVDSVFAQNIPSLELIVMDGGSMDGTVEVLGRLAQRHGPALRWFSEPDRGPAHALNKAFDLARGEIIGWLNSDDCYAPGALNRALRVFEKDPSCMMVYGEASHIDAFGEVIGSYPSLRPDAWPEAFQAGCFICQPSVFLRRAALRALGTLNENLATAFDFELWLRLFHAFPGRIGFVEAVQAFSRLHEATITTRQRRQVAIEAIRILKRHLGRADIHWLATYREEALAQLWTDDEAADLSDLAGDLASLCDLLSECFEPNQLERFRRELAADVRIRFAGKGVLTNIYPDGWVPPEFRVSVRRIPRYCDTLIVRCRHQPPAAQVLDVNDVAEGGRSRSATTWRRYGSHDLRIPLAGRGTGQRGLVFQLACGPAFVPAHTSGSSDDLRLVTFQVEDVLFE
jgi:glycosyltransferase involved in cell wall biosynthesis